MAGGYQRTELLECEEVIIANKDISFFGMNIEKIETRRGQKLFERRLVMVLANICTIFFIFYLQVLTNDPINWKTQVLRPLI